MRFHPKVIVLVAVFALVLVLAACGGTEEATGSDPAESEEMTGEDMTEEMEDETEG